MKKHRSPGEDTSRRGRYVSLFGYVGGVAGTDASKENALAVTLHVPLGNRTVSREYEICGELYTEFAKKGLFSEGANFRLDYYADGHIDLVPIQAPGRDVNLKGLEKLKAIEDALVRKAIAKRHR